MSDVNCNVSDETLQYRKEFLEKYPEAPNWDKRFVEPLMISFIANKKKKKREKRKSHADYCKTYDKKRKLNSDTDMGHSSRNNTKQKGEKLRRYHVYVLWYDICMVRCGAQRWNTQSESTLRDASYHACNTIRHIHGNDVIPLTLKSPN